MTKGKKQQQQMQGQINYLNQQMMLMMQVMQHWGAMQQDQTGEFFALFDASRNMPCAWLNSDAKCENPECNFNAEQCVFTAMMSNCGFYEPIIDTDGPIQSGKDRLKNRKKATDPSDQ